MGKYGKMKRRRNGERKIGRRGRGSKDVGGGEESLIKELQTPAFIVYILYIYILPPSHLHINIHTLLTHDHTLLTHV